MNRRIAITGIGCVSSAGEGASALWNAAIEGRSGARWLDWGHAIGAARPAGAPVPAFDGEKYVAQRKSLKVMARDIQLAVAGASLAIRDARAEKLPIARERFGMIAGSGVLNHELDELVPPVQASLDGDGRLDLRRFGDEGMSALFPLWLLKYLPNMPACHVSILFDLQGPNNTLTTGVSSGLQAIGEAFRVIERGAADLMLAGGSESKLNPVGFSQYGAEGRLARVDGEPSGAYRPFEPDARGAVIGEGACFLVLEELSHARARGARVYATIAGFGASCGDGREIALSAALEESKWNAGTVDSIEASATGILAEDEAEAEAIARVFGAESPAVTSAKPILGFTGYASGAFSAALAALSLAERAVPPLLNATERAGGGRLRVVRGKALRQPMQRALAQSFGLGGQSAVLALENGEAK